MGAGEKWYQEHPFKRCKNILKGGRICGDPRCCLDCRKAWGRRQVWMVQSRLNELDNHFIYFATMVVKDADLEGHRCIRRIFSRKLNHLKKRIQADIQFRAAAEMGNENPAIHYHACFYSEKPLTHGMIREVWAAACEGREVIVEFDEARHGEKFAVKYIFKDERRKTFLRLFKRRTIPITWQSRKFFGITAGEFEKLLIGRWKATLPPPPLAGFFSGSYLDDDTIPPTAVRQDQLETVRRISAVSVPFILGQDAFLPQLGSEGCLMQNYKCKNLRANPAVVTPCSPISIRPSPPSFLIPIEPVELIARTPGMQACVRRDRYLHGVEELC